MSAPWSPFPSPDAKFEYRGDALRENWDRLHRGDREPFPTDPAAQEAWRLYHAGEFEAALKAGIAAGPDGYNAANKAATVYAGYLEGDADRKLEILLDASKRCEELQKLQPDSPNAWYLHAFALGRYSQGISIVTALAQGLGGTVKASLDRTLKLQPEHADAHIALGAYHAEIIDKVGGFLGGLTYGASKDDGVKHFENALRYNPVSAIARLEYAKGLRMMYGSSKEFRAKELLEEASRATAADAMEFLDVAAARALLAAG